MVVATVNGYDLILSPDDDGYYWQFEDKTSSFFDTQYEAEHAFALGQIIFN